MGAEPADSAAIRFKLHSCLHGDRLEEFLAKLVVVVVAAVLVFLPAPAQLASFDRRNISARGKTGRAGLGRPRILLAQQSLSQAEPSDCQLMMALQTFITPVGPVSIYWNDDSQLVDNPFLIIPDNLQNVGHVRASLHRNLHHHPPA